MPADTDSRLNHIARLGKRDLSNVGKRLSSCRPGHCGSRLPREVLQLAPSEASRSTSVARGVVASLEGPGTARSTRFFSKSALSVSQSAGGPCFSKSYKTYSACAGSSRASQPMLSSNCGELQPLVGCSRRLSLETCFSALRCLRVTTTCVGLFITIAPMHLLTCLDSATLGLLHSSLYFVPIAAFKLCSFLLTVFADACALNKEHLLHLQAACCKMYRQDLIHNIHLSQML